MRLHENLLGMGPSDILLKISDGALMQSGDTPSGALYSSEEHRQKIFKVMLDAVRRPTDGPLALVDLGCCTGTVTFLEIDVKSELAGRNLRIRADYGVYEYTAFAWRPNE